MSGLKWGPGLVLSLVCLHAAADDRLVVSGAVGKPGGRLVAVQRSEPKTLNWVIANDAGSREVLVRLMADLIHINRETLEIEPALAKSWKVSPDRLHWTLNLRNGVRFSDGHSFDSDDVVFTFHAILDETVHSPQRDLLMVGDKPVVVRKIDAHTVAFDFPGQYSVPERLFDGVWILPRHKLEAAWKEGKLGTVWGMQTPSAQIAGLGPFRLRQYVPGQRVTLERNPYYWKRDQAGTQLPYFSEVTFLFVDSADAQVMRFQAGEADMINRVGGRNFAVLERDQQRRNYEMHSSGPGLEYAFMVFNLAGGRAPFLQRKSLRQAVSAAVDRDSMVRIIYGGRAVPLAVPVPAGNKRWLNTSIPAPVRSIEKARKILSDDGFKWSREGGLLDPTGKPVEFSIIASNNNPERLQMAGMIQDDLKQIGIKVNVVPMESRSMFDLVQNTRAFDAALAGLVELDVDPNPDMAVWLSSGGNHLWNVNQTSPATPWEAEIDKLMRQQIVTGNFAARKLLFDRVQEILLDQQPMVALLTPYVLTGARKDLGNFRPAILEPNTLWNIEQLYWRNPQSGAPK
ncbi:MAG TPA: ABC transporter substrate-binding protein [Candidatus Solibacter sp.]|nr:ABC transporter substrate-binding protein [Candidatus Solibacter sp.]